MPARRRWRSCRKLTIAGMFRPAAAIVFKAKWFHLRCVVEQRVPQFRFQRVQRIAAAVSGSAGLRRCWLAHPSAGTATASPVYPHSDRVSGFPHRRIRPQPRRRRRLRRAPAGCRKPFGKAVKMSVCFSIGNLRGLRLLLARRRRSIRPNRRQ